MALCGVRLYLGARLAAWACCVGAAAGQAADLEVQPVIMTWTIAGVQREALVIAPAKATPQPPLLLVFHGHGGGMRAQARLGFQKQWPEAVVVCPQGLPTATARDPRGERSGWQPRAGVEGDRDLLFVDALLRTMSEKYSVDRRRVYATGHSNGGGFTYLLWAQRSREFAAFAPSAAAGASLREAKEVVPRPILHVAGKRDEIVPFASQERAMERVREQLGCRPDGQPWATAGGLAGTLYPAERGTPFVAVVHDGTHQYPATAPALIVKFFQQHAQPAFGAPSPPAATSDKE